MADTVTIFSVNDGPAHNVTIFDEDGVPVSTGVTTTYNGAGTSSYDFTVPGALAPGYYSYGGYRTSNGRLRSQGEFYWDGTDIVRTEAIELDAAAVETAVGTALATYDPPTNTELQQCCTDIQNDIAALNNLGVADVVTALGTYGAATAGDVTTAQAAVLAAVSALQDLSAAQVTAIVQAELLAYDGTTQSDLDAAQLAIENLVNSTAGLTVAQSAILTFIRDVIEADEVYTNTTAQKLLKGTATVLVDKTVTTATPCTINTTITEAP